jgi:hypothetical protein
MARMRRKDMCHLPNKWKELHLPAFLMSDGLRTGQPVFNHPAREGTVNRGGRIVIHK